MYGHRPANVGREGGLDSATALLESLQDDYIGTRLEEHRIQNGPQPKNRHQLNHQHRVPSRHRSVWFEARGNEEERIRPSRNGTMNSTWPSRNGTWTGPKCLLSGDGSWMRREGRRPS
ncbi:hypothetical protein CesoFtcFv8_022568 [Champsocephalus esox]|uniref:Uncharacterized protein n=1 Tax=Champsocephalus esox TaxID=159716 RepID=A0AAN8GK70_9TELE|nr:hypothetical protein CesoFtcFv8_022568 [Champsocephalus esox]